MRCPSCGANVDSAYCGYCGTKMPIERVETQSINGDHVVINNYYYSDDAQPDARRGRPAGAKGGPSFAGPVSSRPTYARAPYDEAVSPKSRTIALLLCFFLGVFGAHRFYVGRYFLGIVFFFTFGFLGFGWLVDLVLALLGRMRDRNRLLVSDWSL